MYFKQKNKTAIQSQHMIADALFRLLKRKPFQQISVTELCQEAAIGRKTFYRNFEKREDVIDFQLDRMCEEYRQGMNDLTQLVYDKFCTLRPDVTSVWSEDPGGLNNEKSQTACCSLAFAL